MCPAVNTVVRSIQIALREPSDVAVLKATRAHSMEGDIPVKGLPGHLRGKTDENAPFEAHGNTYLSPPLVCGGADGLGMSLLVSGQVRANVGDLSAVNETRRNGESLDGVDGHLLLRDLVS